MSQLITHVFAIVVLLGIQPIWAAEQPVMTMTYKLGAKPPMMAEAPNNSGIYLDLFTLAAERIGYRLELKRMPKVHLHKDLAQGTIDFYPGASFSEKRAEYLYWIDNGLITAEYGLTAAGRDPIPSYQSLRGSDCIWLMEHGSSKEQLCQSLGLKRFKVRALEVNRAREFILDNPGLFYVADKEIVDHYLMEIAPRTMAEMGLMVHPDAGGGPQPLYLGFSRESPLFKELPNPEYDAGKPMSIDNFPVRVDPDCPAAALGRALQELKREGITQAVYDKYFGLE